jgi:hypothetical protein
MQPAVPLWKVIVGIPMSTNSNRARKGPVFLCMTLRQPLLSLIKERSIPDADNIGPTHQQDGQEAMRRKLLTLSFKLYARRKTAFGLSSRGTGAGKTKWNVH